MEEGLEPKRTISLSWDDPWKKYEERRKKNTKIRIRNALCYLLLKIKLCKLSDKTHGGKS